MRYRIQLVTGVTFVTIFLLGCGDTTTAPVLEALIVTPSPASAPFNSTPESSPATPTPQPLTGTPASDPTGQVAPPSLEVVGQLGGSIQATFIQGKYGYLSVGLKLLIFDLANPAKPEVIGAILLPHLGRDVTVLNNLAYIGAADGLYLVDVSIPAAPTLIGSFTTPGAVSSVTARSIQNGRATSTYAYLTYITGDSQSNGLMIVDVSNPATPLGIGSFATPGRPQDVVVVANAAQAYAYLAEEGPCRSALGPGIICAGTVRILDVSNAAAPTELTAYQTEASARQVVVSQERAYVAQEFCNMDISCAGGLLVLDVSNLTNPKPLGSHPTLSSSVVVDGDYAYLDNLHIVNISSPANMSEVSNRTEFGGRMAAVVKQTAYLFERAGRLITVNVAKPSTPTLLTSYDLPGPISGQAVALADGYAYIADSRTGLSVIDVSHPATPAEVGRYTSDLGRRIWAVSDQRVYLGDEWSGLEVIDVTDPAAPTKVGAYQPGQPPIWGITGHFAYLSNPAGTWVVDLGDPARPVEAELKEWPTPANALGVAVADGYAYVGRNEEGWQIVDLSNPAQPLDLGFAGGASGLKTLVADGYSYNAFNQEMQIVDLTDPAHPIPRGAYQAPGFIWEIVAVVDGLAYLVEEGRLHLVDVSNPDQPHEVGAYGESFQVQKVLVKDNYLYLLWGTEALRVLDISNPAQPVALSHYALPGSSITLPIEMKLIDQYLYMFSYAETDLRVIDVSDPTALAQVGLYKNLGQIWAVEVAPDGQTYAYIYDNDRNVRILKLVDLTTAAEVGFFDAPDWPAEMSVINGRIYLNLHEELVIVDASNPANSVDIGRYRASVGTGPIQQTGGSTYIPTSHLILQVLDLVNSAEAKTVSLFAGVRPGQLEKIIADQQRVYMVLRENSASFDNSLALQVIDVANPTTAREIGYYQPTDFEIFYVVGIENSYLYLVDQQARLRLIDLSDPTQPQEVATSTLAGFIQAVTVEGNYIYLVGNEIGLVILRLAR